jgi:hypothetical protein
MTRNAWTTHEVARLKLIFRHSLESEIAEILPRHSLSSIKDMAHRQGLHRGQRRISSIRKWQRIAAAHVPTFTFGNQQAAE